MDQDITKPKKNIGVLKWVLIIGIVIVLNLFFNFAIKSVYPEPKFENFCKQEQINVQPTTREQCVAKGGQWNENSSLLNPAPVTDGQGKTVPIPAQVAPKDIQTTSYCDTQFTCRQTFQDASDLYRRNVFIVWVALGIIAIITSLFLAGVTVVTLGLSLGGIVSLVMGSLHYWSAMQDYLRVIILGLALVVLIWLGVKKFKD